MSGTAGRPAALVTGAAIRLGRALATGLAAQGYDIALHYNSSEAAARETARDIAALGVACDAFQADLADANALDSLVADVRSRFPDLAVLVNSASAYGQAPIMETTAELYDTQMAVNLRAPFFLTQAFARHAGSGCVVNIIDNKIAFNQYTYAAYLLAKKSLAEFTRMAAMELAPAIRVNGIAPGVVLPAGSRSDAYVAWRLEGIPLRRQGATDDINAAMRYLLDSPFVTGQVLVVDGGENTAHIGRNFADYTDGTG